MELKAWLLGVRILNILCAALMVGFEIWFIIQLVRSDKGFFVLIIRLLVPVFVLLLAVTIVTAQFKYSKVVEHFKFLQFIPGLALFNLFMASLFAFQFSTLYNNTATILTGVFFIAIAASLTIMHCLKPAGTQSLLAAED